MEYKPAIKSALEQVAQMSRSATFIDAALIASRIANNLPDGDPVARKLRELSQTYRELAVEQTKESVK